MLAAQIAGNSRQIEAAQVAFEGVREEAKLGARTTLEVLDAEQDLLDARAARIQSEAERYYSLYSVLATTGLLTVEKLNLGIPTYDVTAYYNAVKDALSLVPGAAAGPRAEGAGARVIARRGCAHVNRPAAIVLRQRRAAVTLL